MQENVARADRWKRWTERTPEPGLACDPDALGFLVGAPVSLREINAVVHSGLNDSDACERVLVRADRITNALELEIGEGFAAMSEGRRLISLGYASLGDYAREVLGDEPRTAENRAHLARELRTRPLLRAAVHSGEVGRRAAELVLSVAVGDEEERWVEQAKVSTTRALARLVGEARKAAGKAEEVTESFRRMRLRMSPENRSIVDVAALTARRLVPGSTLAQQLEAMAQEYLGFSRFTGETEAGAPPGQAPTGCFGLTRPPDPGRADREEAERESLEVETDRWCYLESHPPVAAEPFKDLDSARAIDARLRELAGALSRWDAIVGQAARWVRRSGLWKIAGFQSFRHYCEERLKVSPRTIEQRARLEDQLAGLPALREARDEGLNYDKVRQLANLRDPARVARWIPKAWKLTCFGLQRWLAEEGERQMRAERKMSVRVPEGTASLLEWAFRAVRAQHGPLLWDEDCLSILAWHFVETYQHDPKVQRSLTRAQRILARDYGCCQAPGCSRRATHVHHVVFRSRGGSDDEENLISLCAFHHLVGIHEGYMQVEGTAPGGLAWTVAGRPFTAGAQVAPLRTARS